MLRTIPTILLVGLAMLVACRPEETFQEVTRLVETQDRVEIEVTRVIAMTVVAETTRVVPVTKEVPVQVEVTREPLGTAARPVQLLFSPHFDPELIARRGQPLAEALSSATGYEFAVGILDNEQALIDLMCAAPGDTIGFLTPASYVVAHDQCDVQVGSVAVGTDGLTSGTGMIVARRESEITDLAALADSRLAIPDQNSLTTALFFEALLRESGIAVDEIVPLAGESVTMLAIHDGEVDVAAAEFIPPIMPFEEGWNREEDDPEPWRALGHSPERSPIGYVRVLAEPQDGGYRVRDARSRVIDVAPEIFEETDIVTLSAPIPNDTVAFGRDFPLGLARQLTAELETFGASPACQSSLCSSDFYAWAGLAEATDEMYEPIRFVQETLELSAADMLELKQ